MRFAIPVLVAGAVLDAWQLLDLGT
jgi:hypothetical protein